MYVHRPTSSRSMHTYANTAVALGAFSNKNPLQRAAQPPNLSPMKRLSSPLLLSRPKEASAKEQVRAHAKEMHARGCYNLDVMQFAVECDSCPGLPYPLTKHNSTLPRRREPRKPLPYQEPIPSYPVPSRKRLHCEKRSVPRRKTVTFAGSVSHSFARADKEKLPELAYLVVDVQRRIISDESCQASAKSLKETTFPRSQKWKTSPARQRTMSLTTENKPKPLPRRKTGISPTVNQSTTTPESMRYSMESTPLPLQSQPAQEETPVSPDSTQQTDSQPTSDKHHPVPRIRRRDSSKPKPLASSPQNEDVHLNTGSSPPTETDAPPPLPDKSPLSREIQRSVKKPSSSPKRQPPPPPAAYESPRRLRPKNTPLCTQHVHCTECYETEQQDTLDRTTVDDATATNTELYIDPTQSQQLLLSGKPKPPRPPPPSKSAIRKAQQRKSITMATSRPAVKTSNKSSKYTPTVRTSRHHKNAVPSSSLPLTSSVSKSDSQQQSIYEVMDADDFARRPADYEDLDAGDSFSSDPPSHPPPLPAANQSRKFSSEPQTGTAPTLPPRAPTNSTRQRPPKNKSRPIPSGFTRTTPGADLHSSDEMKHSSNPEMSEREVQSLKYDEDAVYEPVDTSMPLLPHRRKKNIRGTQITAHTNKTKTLANIHPVKGSSTVQRAATVRSDPVPRRIPPLHSQPVNKHALTGTGSFSPQLHSKASRYVSLSGEGKGENSAVKGSQLNDQEDEGGVEEYVDMQCRIGWVEEEDTPDMYVDMHPVHWDREEEEEEDGPCMGPYASSDLLDRRPDLRT